VGTFGGAACKPPAKPQPPGNRAKERKSDCNSIQESYNIAAEQNNAKWWTRFWGSVLLGGVVGGPIGATSGGGIALLYDESRQEYDKLTNDYTGPKAANEKQN
jgi:hypothetical protein